MKHPAPYAYWAVEWSAPIAPLKTTFYEARTLGRALLFVKDWRGYMHGPVKLYRRIPAFMRSDVYECVTSGPTYNRFVKALDVSQ